MKERITLSVDTETLDKAKEFAARKHCTVSQLFTSMIWDNVETEETHNRMLGELIRDTGSDFSRR